MDVKDFALYGLNDAQKYLMQALDGLTDEQLLWQPQPGANHIAFILWHMFREEDRFFQYKLQGVPQIWEESKWHERLNLPYNPQDVGFGWTAEQVAAFPHIRLGDLLAYGEAVRARTLDYLQNVEPAIMDDIVESDVFGDTSVGNRISHLIVELAEHTGQIDYVRGLIEGQGTGFCPRTQPDGFLREGGDNDGDEAARRLPRRRPETRFNSHRKQ